MYSSVNFYAIALIYITRNFLHSVQMKDEENSTGEYTSL